MRLISRLLSCLSTDPVRADARSALSSAERLLRAGGSVAEIRRLAVESDPSEPVSQAWRALFLGDLSRAQELAYAAAVSRPYDVDSRIVHGTVRLARNELEHADHEFEAVIEEFGAEADAADGRRAAILARGHAPLDDMPASEADWDNAATLLTTLWRLAGLAQARMAALNGGHADGLTLIQRALERGDQIDSEVADGSV